MKVDRRKAARRIAAHLRAEGERATADEMLGFPGLESDVWGRRGPSHPHDRGQRRNPHTGQLEWVPPPPTPEE